MTERKHHLFSPSKLQLLEACPSFDSQDSANEAALRGTLQHSAIEAGQDNPELSDEEASAVAECMDFFERQKQLLVEERARAQKGYAGLLSEVVEFKEIFLPIDAENTTAGYLDCGLISYDGKRAVLVDWKMGAWSVEEASSNLQSIAYSIGIFYAFPRVEAVDFYFVQPKVGTSHARWTRADVPALYLRIKTVVEKAKLARALGDFSTARATVPTCQFCANIARCPRVSELVIQVAQKFYPAALPADLDAHALSDPAQTAIGLRLANIVTVWSEAFKKACNDRVLRGVVPPPEGYELTSRAERAIINPDTFRAVALSVLTSAEFDATLDIRLGAVEKAVSAKAPRGSKTAAVEDFKQKLLDNGAVKMGQPYSFLKAIPPKKNQTETTEK